MIDQDGKTIKGLGYRKKKRIFRIAIGSFWGEERKSVPAKKSDKTKEIYPKLLVFIRPFCYNDKK